MLLDAKRYIFVFLSELRIISYHITIDLISHIFDYDICTKDSPSLKQYAFVIGLDD